MKAKHPPTVNIWGGISSRGATKVAVFTGTLTATRYVNILEATLLPFLETEFIRMVTGSNRIMIQNTQVTMPVTSLKTRK